MKFFFNLFLVFFPLISFGQINSNSTYSIHSNILSVGNGSDSNKILQFKKQGGSTQPGIRYNSSTGRIELSIDGTTWTQVATTGDATPVGTIIAYGGSTCPAGFLLEDGTTVSRTTYAALYAVTGDSNGSGDGSTTFNLADLRGQFLRGVMPTGSVTGSGTPSSNNATFTAHGFTHTGMRVRPLSGTLTGITAATTYYVIVVDANTLAFATTKANALAGTKVSISGTNSLVIQQWEDPDNGSRVAGAIGGNSSGIGSVQEGQIQSHNHTLQYTGTLSYSGGGGNPNTFPANYSAGATQFQLSPTGGNETRPTNSYVSYCIKY